MATLSLPGGTKLSERVRAFYENNSKSIFKLFVEGQRWDYTPASFNSPARLSDGAVDYIADQIGDFAWIWLKKLQNFAPNSCWRYRNWKKPACKRKIEAQHLDAAVR